MSLFRNTVLNSNDIKIAILMLEVLKHRHIYDPEFCCDL